MYALDMDIAGYQSFFQRRLATDYKDNAQEFLSTIRSQVEKAITDPDFNWFEIGVETGFVEACDDDPTWPFKTSADVIYYFQLLTFDILYPERALSLAEQELLRRTVLYLMLELEKESIGWISSTALLEQLRAMRQSWAHLEDYHLYCICEVGFLELAGGWSIKIRGMQLKEYFMDVLKISIKETGKPYGFLDDFEWPPTSWGNGYSKEKWLFLVQKYPYSR